MRTKQLIWVPLLVILLPGASAGIVISQVLYDPVGTESGGEAVELQNTGSSAVNISGWVVGTETSDSDATIPDNTVLPAGGFYLIADKGWNTAKDNPDWRLADHEETLTMANANSGVALKDATGTILDAVGWGSADDIEEGLFEGSPAIVVGSGKALVRLQDTNNNADDFVEQEPMFFGNNALLIAVNVTNTTQETQISISVREDDGPESGVQLMPSAGNSRTINFDAWHNGSISVSWFNKTIIPGHENDHWYGSLQLDYWQAPGLYELTALSGSSAKKIPVQVLELRSARLGTRLLSLTASQGGKGKGTIKVWNNGNVPVKASWSGKDLFFGNEKISFEQLEFEDRTIMPAEEKPVEVILRVPQNTMPGEYRTVARLQ
jgi:hypothetical protein